MEKLLTFQDLMSGTRVLWNEEKVEIKDMGWVMYYENAPEVIKKMYWWDLPYSSLMFLEKEEKNHVKLRNWLSKEYEMEDCILYDEAKQKASIKISHDDSITIWVYLNNKNIWNELVEYFGSEERVWKTYIRWRH